MATEVVIPMLGITVERGKIVEWSKKEGDPLEKGEIIFVVEVEKATTEVESPAAGILAKILVPEGIEVPVLTVVGVITDPDEALPPQYIEAPPLDRSPAAEEKGPSETIKASQYPETRAPSADQGIIRAVPAARHLAGNEGLDLNGVDGTGPDGVILLSDVERLLTVKTGPPPRMSTIGRRIAEREGVSPEGIQGTGVRGRIMKADVERALVEKAAPGLGKVIPMNTMRKVIARRMSESAFTAPHIYFFTDMWMDPLLEFRKSILPDIEEAFGLRPSINDFLIKAVALNILDFPILNATIRDDAIHILPQINVCLAVALPDGLIVPALLDTDRVGLLEIVKQRKDLVQRAQQGKLTPEELERGTFTISSLAQYDITYFTAILNPPQSGILSVGKTREELTLVEGDVRARKVATMGLGVDHRIIDGAVAADFLQALKKKLERPAFSFLNL